MPLDALRAVFGLRPEGFANGLLAKDAPAPPAQSPEADWWSVTGYVICGCTCRLCEGAHQQPKTQGAGPNVVALWQDDRRSSCYLMRNKVMQGAWKGAASQAVGAFSHRHLCLRCVICRRVRKLYLRYCFRSLHYSCKVAGQIVACLGVAANLLLLVNSIHADLVTFRTLLKQIF